jgi:hypothetical protein
MFDQFIDPGALLARAYPLPSGSRVRLRLAHGRDRAGLAELLERSGLEVDDFEVRRALSFDPRRRVVIAATCPIDGRETLVGVGGIDYGSDDPDLLVGPDESGVRQLLAAALRARAATRNVP